MLLFRGQQRGAARAPLAISISVALVIAVVLGGAPAPCRASLPDIAGLGTRSPALAGTGTAYLDGYEAVYVNPAGLLGVPRQLTLGVVYGGYQLQLDGGPHPIEATSGLLLGAALPLPLGGVMRDRLALGFGFYLPFGLVNRARDPFPDVPRAELLESRTGVVSVLVGAGVRLPLGLSVGAGVLALAALVGEILIAPDGSGRITAASQEQLTVDYAPIVGVRWRPPGGRVQLGAVFRGTSKSSYRTLVKSQLGDTLPLDLPTITIAGVAQYDPLQLAVEGAFSPASSLILVANLTWKHWSAYTFPVEQATAGADPPPSPDFHDTVVPRLAVEWLPPATRAGRFALRLGYFFEWSPAPPDEATRSLLDASRHVLSCGLSHRFTGRVPLVVDAYFQWHQLAPGQRLSGGFALSGLSLGVNL